MKLAKILLVLSLLNLNACLMTREDIRAAEQKRAVQDQVIHLQKNTADVSNKHQELEDQMREMNGRVERLEALSEQHQNQIEKSRSGQESQTGEQQKTLALIKDEILTIQSQISALAAQVAELQSSKSAAAKASSKDSKKEPISAFKEGEDLLSKKEWKKAILSYQKYRDAQPKGKLFPEATYKIGVAFQELGMGSEAKSFFDEVIQKFPNSDSAKKAKTRLKRIK